MDGDKLNLYRYLTLDGGEHLRWKVVLKDGSLTGSLLEQQAHAHLHGSPAAELGALGAGDAAERCGVDGLRRNAEVGVVEQIGERAFGLQGEALGDAEPLLQLGGNGLSAGADQLARARVAEAATGDFWESDPGCYLLDSEIKGEVAV